MPNISELFIKNAPKGEYWDSKLSGFGIRVGARTKTFLLKQHNSRTKLGQWPHLSLQDARRKAHNLKATGTSHGPNITVKEARELFLEAHCRDYRPRSKAEAERHLKRLSKHDSKRLDSLTTFHVQQIQDDLKPSEANHFFKVCRTFFRFCARRQLVQVNPIANLTIPNRETSRARVLSDEELKCIWRACSWEPATRKDAAPLSSEGGRCQLPRTFATIVKLLILTGQRRSEIAGLRAEYMNCAVLEAPQEVVNPQAHAVPLQQCTITFPSSLTKNGREHTFPIGTFSTKILLDVIASDASEPTLLFAARGKPHTPFNGWSKSKAALDKLSGVKDWTLHDLRRTYATGLASLQVAPHIIERLLNHQTGTISGVAAIYNRNRYVPEMRQAVDLWEAHIQKILGTV